MHAIILTVVAQTKIRIIDLIGLMDNSLAAQQEDVIHDRNVLLALGEQTPVTADTIAGQASNLILSNEIDRLVAAALCVDRAGTEANPVASSTGLDHLYRKPHEEFGFDVPGGCVGSDNFRNIDDVIAELDSSRPIVLNMGDSTTAGYNAEHLYTGKTDIEGILFGHKTYSELLNQEFENNVINAGIPGASSLQVRKKLRWLLEKLQQAGKSPSFVTIYVGNNDGRHGQEHKCWLDDERPTLLGGGVKVTKADYAKNLSAMIKDIRDFRATPILIRPLSNRYAEPLVVTRTYPDDAINGISSSLDSLTRFKLEQARRAWTNGDLELAVELDTKLCRIKQGHLDELAKVARKTRTHLIDLQDQLNIRSLGDADRFFVDYTHVNEHTHSLIANAIKSLIDSGNTHSEPSFEELAKSRGSSSLVSSILLALVSIMAGLLPSSKSNAQNDELYPHW